MKQSNVLFAIIIVFGFALNLQIFAFTNVIKEEGTFLIKEEKEIRRQTKPAVNEKERKIAEIEDFYPKTNEEIRRGEEIISDTEIAPEAIILMGIIIFAAFYISINYDCSKAAGKQI